MKDCADMVSMLDEKMLSLNNAILECVRQKNEEDNREKNVKVTSQDTAKLGVAD